MQKVTFLYVGRVKTPWISEGCKQFEGRLQRSMDIDYVEVPPSRNLDDAKQRQEESASILRKLEKMEGDVWLLDEKGEEMSSTDFADLLGKAYDQGRPLVFILGGAYGVDDSVRRACKKTLCLSKMTFPHELCCLVFLEQLYRAGEIRKGSGYHH